jgi:trimeric autotransporter adhesin
MRRLFTCIFSLILILAFTGQSVAQQSQAATAASGTSASPVPRLIKFSGVLLDHQGQPLKGPVGVTFSLYAQQSGDSPLWMETQNVEVDEKGVYAVLLGANTATGLPQELFLTGDARWLGIQPEREPELPRILLVSAPYALKAADADTIRGLPPSAFVLAGVPMIAENGSSSSPTSEATTSVTSGSGSNAVAPAVGTIPVTTAGGTVNLLAKFDAAADITKSLIFDNGTNVGVGNTAPAAKLDVSGSGIFRGVLQLPATGTANSTTHGFNSQPFDFLASVFNGTTAENEHFRWRAEPVNPGLATASGKLSLLFASGTGTPAETGLSIANNGRITFASGQTFPSAGTITGVIAGTDLTGGGNTGNVTLNLDTTKVPRLAAANTFTASQSVIGTVTATNVTATGIVSGAVVNATNVNAIGAVNGAVVNATTSFDLGGAPFASGSAAKANLAVGFGALGNNPGIYNTAIGNQALISNTSGSENVATGFDALLSNTSGTFNTATGMDALFANTTGSSNTASGWGALSSNITGNYNVASGGNALYANTNGFQNTASGSYALAGNTTGWSNTASGISALNSNTKGNLNTASGAFALYANTTGNNNTAIGYYALKSNTAGSLLTCIGYGCDAGVDGLTNATAIGANAVVGESNALVLGSISGVNNATSNTNVGIGTTTPQYTLDVVGNVHVSGSLSKGSGSFKIDHPLDPANKYLYHSFVESPDMMNVYNGNVVTDKNGKATVVLPEYFEALNRDFRYQLTVVGQFAQAIVAKKVEQNRFVIRTSKPNVEVSWQVTGIRQDAYANAHRIEVEEDKPQQEQGHYLHPELFGASPEQAVGYQAPPTPTHAETARVSTSASPSIPLK